ncbi:hypothetical protein RB195_009393 [Necator americanus]
MDVCWLGIHQLVEFNVKVRYKRRVCGTTSSSVLTATSLSTSTFSTTVGRSAYFVRRSASCANPFRKPVIKATSETLKSDSKEEPEETPKDGRKTRDDEDDIKSVGVTLIKKA